MTLVVGFLLSALSWRLLLFSSLPAGVIGFAFPPPATTTTATAAAAAGTCSASSSCWLPRRRRRQKRGTAFAVGPLYMFDFFNPKPTTSSSGGTATTTAATTTEASKEEEEEEEETATAAATTAGGEATAVEQEERAAPEVVPEDTPADVAVATEEEAAEEEATGEGEKDAAAAVVGVVSEQEAVEEEEGESDEEETPVIEATDDDNDEEQDEEEAEGDGQPKKVVARERHTVFVGNLPFDVTDDEVRDLFADHGRVALVTMPRDRATGRPRGFAFVDMGSPEQRDAAIQALHETLFGGRTLRVVESVPKDQQEKQQKRRAPPPSAADAAVEDGYEKIYVGNLPFSATREDVISYYEPYGEVREAYLPYNQQTGRIRGFAFVTMKEEDAAAAIEATNGRDFGGRPLTVNYPLPPGEKAPPRRGGGAGRGGGGGRGAGPPAIKLYCGSLSFYTTPETLRELFEEFGDVLDCYLPEDAERGGSRGFGFVTMERDAALAAADELDGIELDGRIIRVNEARPKFTRRQQRREEEEDQQFDDDDEIEIEGGGGGDGGGYGNPNDD